jgi:hypothetical protein
MHPYPFMDIILSAFSRISNQQSHLQTRANMRLLATIAVMGLVASLADAIPNQMRTLQRLNLCCSVSNISCCETQILVSL